MATDPRSWGILGNPTPDQVYRWCNLPPGEFQRMLKGMRSLKKKIKNIPVQVTRIETLSQTSTTVVDYYGLVTRSGEPDDFYPTLRNIKDGSLPVVWSDPKEKRDVHYTFNKLQNK